MNFFLNWNCKLFSMFEGLNCDFQFILLFLQFGNFMFSLISPCFHILCKLSSQFLTCSMTFALTFNSPTCGQCGTLKFKSHLSMTFNYTIKLFLLHITMFDHILVQITTLDNILVHITTFKHVKKNLIEIFLIVMGTYINKYIGGLGNSKGFLDLKGSYGSLKGLGTFKGFWDLEGLCKTIDLTN